MDSFESIYEKYYKKLYLFLYRMSGDSSLSEELTQETLYKAFLHIKQYHGKSSIYTWLCQIAKNNYLLEYKRRNHFCTMDDKLEIADAHNTEQEVINKQMLLLLNSEIHNLPEPYRTVCTLRIYAELSFREIAAEYNKSESWAKVTFFRGKAILTERMKLLK